MNNSSLFDGRFKPLKFMQVGEFKNQFTELDNTSIRQMGNDLSKSVGKTRKITMPDGKRKVVRLLPKIPPDMTKVIKRRLPNKHEIAKRRFAEEMGKRTKAPQFNMKYLRTRKPLNKEILLYLSKIKISNWENLQNMTGLSLDETINEIKRLSQYGLVYLTSYGEIEIIAITQTGCNAVNSPLKAVFPALSRVNESLLIGKFASIWWGQGLNLVFEYEMRSSMGAKKMNELYRQYETEDEKYSALYNEEQRLLNKGQTQVDFGEEWRWVVFEKTLLATLHHIPDLVVFNGDENIAIEIELSRDEEKISKVVKQYVYTKWKYPFVIWIAPSETTARLIYNSIDETIGAKEQFEIKNLDFQEWDKQKVYDNYERRKQQRMG
ncbi:MAG: hypothetical protein LBD23_14800 [Oscillospiraceae bacterium]|jgi:hypothetical protein|nr:hypothetical protein [Oscillospiraceae bacterium]